MFDRARRRLAVQAAVLFALVLIVFSIIFYLVLSTALAPAFDIAPEIPDDDVARQAYAQTTQLIAVALVLADLAAVVGAIVAGYVLAGRTLRPIRSSLERQRRFVADASHEMRTPLTVIRTAVDEAIAQPTVDATVRRDLATVSAATDRLTSLTADLLLLARTEDAGHAPERRPVDLSVAAAEAAHAVRAAVGAEVTLDLVADLVVSADEDGLVRAITNLVDNAWRYSGGRAVEVRTFEQDGHGVVEVRDHGPGIAASDLERIFEPFHRLRADRSAPSGTGLGLAIVRSLVRSWGGTVTVRSRPGSGSTFRIDLPRSR